MAQTTKPSFAFKALAVCAVAALGAAGALTLALRFYLSPDKVRDIVVKAAHRTLKREVRLREVSVSVLKGLVLEGLEVSEAPDFKAGRFAAVRSFQLRVRLLPLLRAKVIVDRIAIDGLEISAVKLMDSRFNFDDLTAGGKEDSKPAEVTLPFGLDVKKASFSDGRVAYRDAKISEEWVLSQIAGQAKDVSLTKPFPVEFSAKAGKAGAPPVSISFKGEADPAGKAIIDALKIDGPDLKVRIAGKVERKEGDLLVAFSRISGDVYGNSLDLSGALSMTPRLIDLPDLKGRLNDSPMSLAAAVETPADRPAMKAKGRLNVAKLVYADAVAHDLTASWDLSGLTPDMRQLGGSAKLHVAGGSFKESQPPRSALVRAILLPLTLLKKVGSAVGSLAGLDFSHILFSEISGDYSFQRGVMTVRDFQIHGAAANVSTKGTVDLAAQTLALSSTILIAKVAPIDVDIGGTFDKPTTRVRLLKTLAEPVKKLVTQPALKLLKNIFKRK